MIEKGAELGSERSNQSSKRSRRRQRRPPAVQRLFDTCKEVFADGKPGVVPSPVDVDRLRSVLDTKVSDLLSFGHWDQSKLTAELPGHLQRLVLHIGPQIWRDDILLWPGKNNDNMTAADVGLAHDLPYFCNMESQSAPPVTYLHIYECDKFSIGIFCLPPSAVIPLHNHPGMTVFSKLLFGSMHIKSYDWVDVPQNHNEIMESAYFQPNGIRLAKVKTDDVFVAPCETSVLYPADGGNMHSFTAKTSCAVLDVLGPPYSDPDGRHCAYYNNFPYEKFSGDTLLVPSEGEEYAWLEEREKPDDFFVVGDAYSGPEIVEY